MLGLVVIDLGAGRRAGVWLPGESLGCGGLKVGRVGVLWGG